MFAGVGELEMAQEETAGSGVLPPKCIAYVLCIDLEETSEPLYSLLCMVSQAGSHVWFQGAEMGCSIEEYHTEPANTDNRVALRMIIRGERLWIPLNEEQLRQTLKYRVANTDIPISSPILKKLECSGLKAASKSVPSSLHPASGKIQTAEWQLTSSCI